jgi:hypothetical protein
MHEIAVMDEIANLQQFDTGHVARKSESGLDKIEPRSHKNSKSKNEWGKWEFTLYSDITQTTRDIRESRRTKSHP